MAVDPYRRLLLDAVSAVLSKPPSSAALLELLRVVAPTLTLNDITDSAERERCFSELRTRVHPDEHRGDRQRATRLHREVSLFYEECLSTKDRNSKAATSYYESGVDDYHNASHHDDQFPDETSHQHQRRRFPFSPKYRPSSSSRSTLESIESCGSCICRHLTDLVALCMVAAFFGFAGYVCYYVLNNSDGG